jgi:hypothetical protein
VIRPLSAIILSGLALSLAASCVAPPREAAKRGTSPAAEQPAAMLRTWAVLASSGLRAGGMEDVILAELSTDKTITLVDRERLDLVATELAAGSLLGSGGAAARRKAGTLLKADGLAILNQETIEGKPHIRLVASETHGGARLRTELIPVAADGKAESTAKAVAAALRGVREHFAQGIRQVYGVPPFVSRSLTYELDPLQRGYASLLAEALSRQPGIAVIEVDEARLIARELGLAGDADLRRYVPVFVMGEFRVPAGATGDAEVEITVKLTAAGGDLPGGVARKMRLSEAARYLTDDLPALVLGRKKFEAGIDAAQQARALAERATAFERLGSAGEAAALREAELLLVDKPAHRQTLIKEYCAMIGADALLHGDEPKTEEQLADCRRRAELWPTALAHVEHLVRNRQVGFQVGLALADQVLAAKWFRGNPALAATVPATQRFIREVFPLIYELKEDPYFYDPLQKEGEWGQVLVRHAVAGGGSVPPDWDFAYKVMMEMLPEDIEYGVPGLSPETNVPGSAEMAARLERSDRPIFALRAKYGRVNYNFYKEPDHEKRLAFSKQVDELVADYRKLEPKLRTPEAAKGLRWDINELAHHAQTMGLPEADPPPHYSSHSSNPPASDPGVTMSAELVPLKVKQLDGKTVPFEGFRWPSGDAWAPMLGLVPCGDTDAFWCYGAIAVMREKGLVEEIVVDRRMMIWDVQWDGKHLWAGDSHAGIRILDLQGKPSALIGPKEGLPESEYGVKICPISPGRAIVAGALGERQRLWLALVEVQGDKPTVKVFHEATRVPTGDEDWWKVGPAIDLAGKPNWIHRLQQTNKDAPPLVLVGWGHMHRPIQVDVNTLKVTLSDEELLSDWSSSILSRDGKLIQGSPGGHLIEDGPNVYDMNLGGCARYNFEKQKFIGVNLLPYGCDYGGMSVHYGMVGWNGANKFFRFLPTFAEKPSAPAPSNK